MDEGGNTKDDLGLPKGTDDAEKLADQIKKDFDDGKELVVTVLKVGFPVFCLLLEPLQRLQRLPLCVLSLEPQFLTGCYEQWDARISCSMVVLSL